MRCGMQSSRVAVLVVVSTVSHVCRSVVLGETVEAGVNKHNCTVAWFCEHDGCCVVYAYNVTPVQRWLCSSLFLVAGVGCTSIAVCVIGGGGVRVFPGSRSFTVLLRKKSTKEAPHAGKAFFVDLVFGMNGE